MYTTSGFPTSEPFAATTMTDAMSVDGYPFIVGRGGGSRANFQEGKLFLGGLDSNTTQETIAEYCSQWGKVTEVVVMENRGFGFVTFESPLSAHRFLDAHHHEIDEKQIEAKAAIPRRLGGCSELTKKMFVGGTGEISDEEFRQHFAKYGAIEDAAIVRKEGISRGFGFITFRNEMSVEKCLVELQILPNGRRVDIKRAVPRDQAAGSYMHHSFDNSFTSVRPQGVAGMIYNPYAPVDYGYAGYTGGPYGYGITNVYIPGRAYGMLDNEHFRRHQQSDQGNSSNPPPSGPNHLPY